MTARFLHSFTITAQTGTLKARNGGVDGTVVIAPGTYFTIRDPLDSEDFLKALTDAWQSTFAWAISGAIQATGRVFYQTGLADNAFYWTDPETTLDPLLMGWPGDADVSFDAGTELAPYAHAAGWYPGVECLEHVQTDGIRSQAIRTVDGSIKSRLAQPAELTRSALYTCSRVKAARVRRNATREPFHAIQAGLTIGDPSAAYEAFCLSAVQDNATTWRFYPDRTRTDWYRGPWRFPGGAMGARRWPARAPTQLIQKAGEVYRVTIPGRFP